MRLRIRTIYEESKGSYGSPRITSELIEEHGIVVTRKAIEHLMRQEGLSVKPKSQFRPTTDSSKTLAPAPNRLDRSFSTGVVNSVWLSDFTEVTCREGKVYVVAIMDMASRRVIGMNVHHRMHTGSLIIALHRACKTRRTFPKPEGQRKIIFHSYRGSPYNSETFRKALLRHDIVQSVRGVGNCYENAPMESLWARMKTELAIYMPFRDPEWLSIASTSIFTSSITGNGVTPESATFYPSSLRGATFVQYDTPPDNRTGGRSNLFASA